MVLPQLAVVREALIKSRKIAVVRVISSMCTETKDVRPHLVGRGPVESNQGATNWMINSSQTEITFTMAVSAASGHGIGRA